MGFLSRRKSSAATTTTTTDLTPPAYEEHASFSSTSASTLPATTRTPLSISKKGLRHNMVVETPFGPLYDVAVHHSFSTRQNPSIKMTLSTTKDQSLLIATAEFNTLSNTSEVILRLPQDKRISATEMLPGGSFNKSFVFPLILGGEAELLEWRPIKDGSATVPQGWNCIRCETGEVVMQYRKARILGRRYGDAEWTDEAVETGIAEGEKGMMVFAALIAVIEKERRQLLDDTLEAVGDQIIGAKSIHVGFI